MLPIHIPTKIILTLEYLEQHGAKCYFVGGIVRDYLMGNDSNDIDVEVFGLTVEKLQKLLNTQLSNVKFAGNAFPVFHYATDDYEVQFSLPRLERAVNQTHKGFDIIVNPYMSVEDAALRRDITINAIYMSLDGRLIDPYDGVTHIKQKVIIPVSEHFKEDPVRVLRIFRQCSQFGFYVSSQAIEYSKQLFNQFHTIEPDLIAKEWLNWSECKYPDRGIEFLINCEWIEHFPLLHDLKYIQQSNKYHPEGNVLNHTLLVLQHAGQFQNSILTFAALFHDIGKLRTTIMEPDGKITSKYHEKVGSEMIEECFHMLHPNFFKSYYNQVKELVALHMHFHNENEISVRNIMKVIKAMQYNGFQTLINLIQCDLLGRNVHIEHINKSYTLIDELNTTFQQVLPLLERNSIKKIIDGKYLISIGLKPSPTFGQIINDALDAQIEGILTEETKQQWLINKGIIYVQ